MLILIFYGLQNPLMDPILLHLMRHYLLKIQELALLYHGTKTELRIGKVKILMKISMVLILWLKYTEVLL
jgi:hypothetical protein